MNLDKRIEFFKNFEVYDPELLKEIESSVDVDYFPRGNDVYLDEFVNIIKQYIKQKVR